MNAIELANGLDKIWDNECRNPIISKSADMLRQQAKEIETLKQYKEKIVSLEEKIEDMRLELESIYYSEGMRNE